MYSFHKYWLISLLVGFKSALQIFYRWIPYFLDHLHVWKCFTELLLSFEYLSFTFIVISLLPSIASFFIPVSWVCSFQSHIIFCYFIRLALLNSPKHSAFIIFFEFFTIRSVSLKTIFEAFLLSSLNFFFITTVWYFVFCTLRLILIKF